MDEARLVLLEAAMLLVCDGREEEAALMVACPPRQVAAVGRLIVYRHPDLGSTTVGELNDGEVVSVWGNLEVLDRIWTFVLNRAVIGWVASWWPV